MNQMVARDCMGSMFFLSFQMSINIVLWCSLLLLWNVVILKEINGCYCFVNSRHWLLIKMNSDSLGFYDDSLWKMITMVQRALIFIIVGFYHQSGYQLLSPFFHLGHCYDSFPRLQFSYQW